MTATEEALKQLAEGYKTIQRKHDALYKVYWSRKYSNPEAEELAKNGFLRRLKTMARCIGNVYVLLPPQKTELSEGDTRYDAEIQIQTFITNVYGSVDNLAWVWVTEKQVTDIRGKLLHKLAVRLDGDLVRETLSGELNKQLDGLKDWFDGLNDYRHALAHKVPVYIPPYPVLEARLQEYNRLEKLQTLAFTSWRFDVYRELRKKQKELFMFTPWIKHSFIEKYRTASFHGQMQADFNAVYGLGVLMAKELTPKQLTKPRTRGTKEIA